MARPINERIEDGILLLKEVMDFVEDEDLELDTKFFDHYNSKQIEQLTFFCTREQFLKFDHYIRDTYPERFYRPGWFGRRHPDDNHNSLYIHIKDDVDANKYQRIFINFLASCKNPRDGTLRIFIRPGKGFSNNKIYGTEIQALTDKFKPD